MIALMIILYILGGFNQYLTCASNGYKVELPIVLSISLSIVWPIAILVYVSKEVVIFMKDNL